MRLTKSTLIRLLQERNILPRRSLGQNFLIDPNFLKFIVDQAGVKPDENILEVGAGPGGLTALLAGRARQVWSVEIDPKMQSLLQDLLGRLPNLKIIKSDILDRRGQKLNPVVVRQIQASRPGSLKVISNLPYASAVPIMIALLESGLPISHLYLLVQWEVAQRLLARPGRKEYGTYTIFTQTLGRVRLIKKVPPDIFWPKPKVQSALVEIVPEKSKNLTRNDYRQLKKIVGSLFQHRRKMIGSAYKNLSGYKFGKDEWHSLLTRAEIGPQQRPEEISIDGFVRLAGLIPRSAYT
ncbi:MAG: ribosomal RNA small subunit methyltransferase A [Planctomycetes bacterium]|nr:ribosomal RNA small subunit methyltransferase A [Planctomycetota bacterium]